LDFEKHLTEKNVSKCILTRFFLFTPTPFGSIFYDKGNFMLSMGTRKKEIPPFSKLSGKEETKAGNQQKYVPTREANKAKRFY